MIEKSCWPIVYTVGNGHPIVAVVGSVHGDEPVGRRIVEKLRDIQLTQGTFIGIVANPCALERHTRFIDTDLNRSFPGNESGTLEEQMAYHLGETLKQADYILDVHSTTTDTRDVAIIKNRTEKVRTLVRKLSPRRVVLVPHGIGDGSLINSFDGAVSLEYGPHEDEYTYMSSFNGVMRVLAKFNMIASAMTESGEVTEYFEVYGTVNRPDGFKMKLGIHNLVLCKKGETLGEVGDEQVYAEESFYPFLFGPESYKNIMGFKARKVDEMWKN